MMAAIQLENDLHQICTTPLEWKYNSSSERDDEVWESFDAAIPEMKLSATFSRERMTNGFGEKFYLIVRNDKAVTTSLGGKEAERLFYSLKESYLEAKAIGLDKFKVGETFPAAYETESPLERATTCLKHGVLDFRAAQIIEAIYASASEAPISRDGWGKSSFLQISDVDGRKEEVTSFHLNILGLEVKLNRFSPVADREVDGSSTSSIPEGMDFSITVTDRHGTEVFSDYGNRAYRYFEKLNERFKTFSEGSLNAA